MNPLKDLAPAVRKETKRVSIFTLFRCMAVMWIALLSFTHASRKRSP